MARHRGVIYDSPRHLLVTAALVAVPFLFFLAFSRAADLAAGPLANDVWVSFLRMFAAYAVAVVLAWISAVAFARGPYAAVALPFFDVLQSFPTFAMLPLVVHFWGTSNLTIIVFLVATVVWPIFFSIVSSLKLMRRDWQEVVTVYHMPMRDQFTRFLLPATFPGVITGSIIGLGEGWEALIATELISGTPQGLGAFFGAQITHPVVTGFGIVGFLLLVFCLNKLVWLGLLEWSHRRMEE